MIFSKKMGALLCLLLTVVAVFCACGSESPAAPEASNEIAYTVKVVDGAGAPYTSGVIVQFLQNGEKAALQTVDQNGVATKTLAKGEYTVELMFTGNAEDYYYDDTNLTLTAQNPELEIVLAQSITQVAEKL